MTGLEFSLRFALIKHDAAIAKAAARQITKSTADLLTVLIGLPLLALVARTWLEGLSSELRNSMAYGASALIATVAAKILVERVWFHQSEGALAQFAQRPSDWLSYIGPLLVAGLLLGFSGLAVVGILDPGGAVLGAGAGVTAGLAIPFMRERVLRWWRDAIPKRGLDLIWQRRVSIIGAIVAAILGAVGAILPQDGYLDVLWAGAYGLLVIVLTGRVDAATVRYMALMGHSPSSLLRHWLPAQIMLLLPFLAVQALAQNWLASGIFAAFALGLLVYTAARIFAYRAFRRLLADWVVAAVVLATGYVALTLPPLAPIIMIIAIVWLARLGSRTTWLIA